ncbi:hypothetical protein ACTA71_000167 [Dictyostelium dimigraforme]
MRFFLKKPVCNSLKRPVAKRVKMYYRNAVIVIIQQLSYNIHQLFPSLKDSITSFYDTPELVTSGGKSSEIVDSVSNVFELFVKDVGELVTISGNESEDQDFTTLNQSPYETVICQSTEQRVPIYNEAPLVLLLRFNVGVTQLKQHNFSFIFKISTLLILEIRTFKKPLTATYIGIGLSSFFFFHLKLLDMEQHRRELKSTNGIIMVLVEEPIKLVIRNKFLDYLSKRILNKGGRQIFKVLLF